jgi:hypothetical protein
LSERVCVCVCSGTVKGGQRAACLAVCEDGRVAAFETRVDQRAHTLIKDDLLPNLTRKDVVKRKLMPL